MISFTESPSARLKRYKEYADNYSEKTAEELDCRIENAKEQKIKS